MMFEKLTCKILGHRGYENPKSIKDLKIELDNLKVEVSEMQSNLHTLRFELVSFVQKVEKELANNPSGISVSNTSISTNTMNTMSSISIGSLSSSTILQNVQGSLHNNREITGKLMSDIFSSHFETRYQVCTRCKTLYANDRFRTEILDSRTVPAFKSLEKWKKEQEELNELIKEDAELLQMKRDFEIMVKLKTGGINGTPL